MRKLGYILLVVGFVWVTFIAVESGPVARAMSAMSVQKYSGQQTYTGKDMAIAYSEAARKMAFFAQPSIFGGLMMLVGGILLAKSGRRDSTAGKPPVL